MKRFLIAVLLLSIGLPGVVSLSGCASKEKTVITPEKKTDFGSANQAASEKARAGMAEMMAKHGNGAPPPPPGAKPVTK